jgi:hypothetical protein
MRIDKGIHRLATAMLLQAVQDSMSQSSGRRNSALRWINGKDQGPFSFLFVCRVLNRDPEEVRRFCLKKMNERRIPSFRTLT